MMMIVVKILLWMIWIQLQVTSFIHFFSPCSDSIPYLFVSGMVLEKAFVGSHEGDESSWSELQSSPELSTFITIARNNPCTSGWTWAKTERRKEMRAIKFQQDLVALNQCKSSRLHIRKFLFHKNNWECIRYKYANIIGTGHKVMRESKNNLNLHLYTW